MGSPFIDLEQFTAVGAWGLSTSINVHDCDPDLIRSGDQIERFTVQLCNLLRVRRTGDIRLVRFGADPAIYGYSMVQMIETSLVSAHFAEQTNAAYIDIFSCRWYDARAAAEFAARFFKGTCGAVTSHLR